MWSSAPAIAPGHIVIVWMTRDNIQSLTITPGKDFNSKYGNYRHDDFVGVPYGSKVASRTGKGFIYLLRPTPELWTLALPHRTQILYLADIAFIVSRLNIKRGSKVIEAGTGSASFSHSVARTIGESGHLWSYEFHEARANKAKDEFTRHGISNFVTLAHRNVCKEGFTVENVVDSVFLDLPAPWDVVHHAKKALKKDVITRICCFSPCMEQVLRTVTALNEAGFTDIAMYETLLRPHEVSHVRRLQHIGEVSEKLKEAEKRREEKRLRQIANNKARLAAGRCRSLSPAAKRKRLENESGEPTNEGSTCHPTLTQTPPQPKRPKLDEGCAIATTFEEVDMIEEDGLLVESHMVPSPSPSPTSRLSVSNALPEVRGHTSYLTFALLVPLPAVGDPSTEGASAPTATSTSSVILPS